MNFEESIVNARLIKLTNIEENADYDRYEVCWANDETPEQLREMADKTEEAQRAHLHFRTYPDENMVTHLKLYGLKAEMVLNIQDFEGEMHSSVVKLDDSTRMLISDKVIDMAVCNSLEKRNLPVVTMQDVQEYMENSGKKADTVECAKLAYAANGWIDTTSSDDKDKAISNAVSVRDAVEYMVDALTKTGYIARMMEEINNERIENKGRVTEIDNR